MENVLRICISLFVYVLTVLFWCWVVNLGEMSEGGTKVCGQAALRTEKGAVLPRFLRYALEPAHMRLFLDFSILPASKRFYYCLCSPPSWGPVKESIDTYTHTHAFVFRPGLDLKKDCQMLKCHKKFIVKAVLYVLFSFIIQLV